MKNLALFFVFLLVAFLSIATMAQPAWETQRAIGLPNSTNPTLTLSAVSSNICWGVQQLEFGITNPKYILTTNGGETWTVSDVQIPPGLGVQSISAMDAQTAFIAVDDPSTGSNSGIYKTTNSGVNWVKQGSAFTGGGHPVSIYFFDSNNGICIGNPRNNDFEIYTTTNGGEDWIQVPGANLPAPDPLDITFSAISSGSGSTFCFGTYHRKIYRSTDKGLTWAKISFSTSPSGAGVDIALKDSLNGLAATYFGDQINRVARTTDAGLTWASLPNPPLQPSFYFLSYVPGANGSTYIATSHNNIGAPTPTTPGSMVTIDNGSTWILLDNFAHGPSSFASDGFGWSGGVNDTVYKISYDALQVSQIPTDSLQLWLKADEGVTLNGSTVSQWTDQSGNGNNVIQPSADRQPLLVANGLNNNKPVLRFDGLNDMLGLTGTKTMSQISLFMVYKVDSGATGPNPNCPLVLGDANIAGKAYGLTMQPAEFTPTPNTLAIWTGSDAWLLASLTDITKYGEWKNLSIVTNQTIHNTTVHSNGQEANIIPQGSDMGISFSLGNAGGPGYGGGIGGADDTPSPPSNKLIFKGDIAEVVVYDTVLSDSERSAVENYLHNKYNITITDVADNQNGSLPEEFILNQNYPNPFNPSTKINYQIPTAGIVSLKVYDVLGKEVATLVNEEKPVGSYEIDFDASKLSSGIYFYKLQAGNFVETKKMILLK